MGRKPRAKQISAHSKRRPHKVVRTQNSPVEEKEKRGMAARQERKPSSFISHPHEKTTKTIEGQGFD